MWGGVGYFYLGISSSKNERQGQKMKFAKIMNHWQQSPDLMEALVQKHYLLRQGYRYVGDSSIKQTSPEFNKELMQNLQKAEEVAMIPLFQQDFSLFLSGRETIRPGMFSFYAVFPEEEEKIPDTLRGGFRVERQTGGCENSASQLRTIKRKLPSRLLLELDNNIILYENVKEFYFERDQNADPVWKFKHTLTLEDITILSKMENRNTLDSTKLKNNKSSAEDIKAGKRLENSLCRSPLVVRVSKGTVYTLSSDALNGMYAAVVHKKYLPEHFI